jgi:chromosome segregation ATPase
MEHRLDEYSKAVGQVIGTKTREKREPLEQENRVLKRELELLRREFTVLCEEVALERELKNLRSEVAKACKQVTRLLAIESRFDARQADLEGKQARLERELAKTKDRLGKMRVDRSIAAYNLAELRKQAQTSAGASVELEFESRSSHFQMKATHPDAARALKDFAIGIINGQADGTPWPGAG